MRFLASLMDVPFKRELVEALRAAPTQESPVQVEKHIQEKIAEALKLAGNDLKARELDMKERLTDAQVEQIMAQAVQTGVQAAFAAMQGGAQVAQMPMIAPIADRHHARCRLPAAEPCRRRSQLPDASHDRCDERQESVHPGARSGVGGGRAAGAGRTPAQRSRPRRLTAHRP
jgi:hypothetical protein